jgi:hypothetical protein
MEAGVLRMNAKHGCYECFMPRFSMHFVTPGENWSLVANNVYYIAFFDREAILGIQMSKDSSTT